MLKINQCTTQNVDKHFRNFQKYTIYSKNKNPVHLITQLQQYEKQYKKLGLLDSFYIISEQFALKLHEMGLNDFAGIILSKLIKQPEIIHERKSAIANTALTIAKEQGDPIHILARLVDLKKINASKNGSKKQYLKILKEEEEILTRILNNFEDSKLQFKTVSRNSSEKEKYQFRLATARVDIGKCLMYSEVKTAKAKLIQALQSFKALGREREAEFATRLISEINN